MCERKHNLVVSGESKHLAAVAYLETCISVDYHISETVTRFVLTFLPYLHTVCSFLYFWSF
jgi:hypothetical protein